MLRKKNQYILFVYKEIYKRSKNYEVETISISILRLSILKIENV